MSSQRDDCKRCGATGPLSRGVHFVLSDAISGACLATYDICTACMDGHSPLIIPAEARRPGVAQYAISFAAFGGYQRKTQA